MENLKYEHGEVVSIFHYNISIYTYCVYLSSIRLTHNFINMRYFNFITFILLLYVSYMRENTFIDFFLFIYIEIKQSCA